MPDSRPPDSELLRQCVEAGDDGAAAVLLERYRARLRRMVAMRLDKRVAARVDPSDIVQEALTKARKRLPQYQADPRIGFYPWLRRITWDRLQRVHRNHIEVEKRSVRREHPWQPNLNDESVADLASQLVNTTVNPDRRMVRAEMHARMNAALVELKPSDREILVMRYLEQMTVGEIADALGVSHTVVTSRQLRALQRLRRRLGDDFADE